jgi:hypothetical protein
VRLKGGGKGDNLNFGAESVRISIQDGLNRRLAEGLILLVVATADAVASVAVAPTGKALAVQLQAPGILAIAMLLGVRYQLQVPRPLVQLLPHLARHERVVRPAHKLPTLYSPILYSSKSYVPHSSEIAASRHRQAPDLFDLPPSMLHTSCSDQKGVFIHRRYSTSCLALPCWSRIEIIINGPRPPNLRLGKGLNSRIHSQSKDVMNASTVYYVTIHNRRFLPSDCLSGRRTQGFG